MSATSRTETSNPTTATSTTPTLAVPSRRQLIVGSAAALAAGSLAAGARPAYASPTGSASAQVGRGTTAAPAAARGCDTRVVRRWAADTWRSLVAMTDERTGLPADNIPASLARRDRSGYTSPTNIGGYLWSAVVARELGVISRREASARIARTLATLGRMGHHKPSGMYYNWYDEASGDVLTTWPDSGDPVQPFASSVDNGWLGAALMVVREADPANRRAADRLFRRMRWDMFFDAAGPRTGGLIHGGFYVTEPAVLDDVTLGNHIGVGPDVWYTNHHYDTTVSETRITSYLGISQGQIPGSHWFAMWRTFSPGCDYSWSESEPVGQMRRYLGIDVYEGALTYRGMRIVPGWGGSMFEELMPDVFVPESSWAPRSWGVNHPLHVRAQKEHGLEEAGYGYWGFSPCSNPAGGYREYGVDALGLNPTGYLSDQESTDFDAGYGTCREGVNPNPTFGDGVVTPHASFLAMMHDPRGAYDNLRGIQHDLKAYGRGGFFDAVAVHSGTVARRYLSLDQAMIMGAVGNVLCDNVIRRAFSTPAVARRLRPVIGIEEFGAGIA